MSEFDYVIMNGNNEYWKGTLGDYAYVGKEYRPDFSPHLSRAFRMSKDEAIETVKVFYSNYPNLLFIPMPTPPEKN